MKRKINHIKLIVSNTINSIKNNTESVRDYSHTIGDLYEHRMWLTRALMHSNKEICWKSRRHHDGTMIPGFFVCGISTPNGDITYHYKEEDWVLFNIKELDYAPEWDGVVGGSLKRLQEEF